MDFSRSCSLSGWSSLFWKWIKSLYFILLFVDLSFFFFFFFPFRRSCLSTRYFYSYISNYSPSFIIILLLLAVAEVAVEAHNLYLLLLLLCIYFLHIFLFYSWNQSALLPRINISHQPPNPLKCLLLIMAAALHLVFINGVMRLSSSCLSLSEVKWLHASCLMSQIKEWDDSGFAPLHTLPPTKHLQDPRCKKTQLSAGDGAINEKKVCVTLWSRVITRHEESRVHSLLINSRVFFCVISLFDGGNSVFFNININVIKKKKLCVKVETGFKLHIYTSQLLFFIFLNRCPLLGETPSLLPQKKKKNQSFFLSAFVRKKEEEEGEKS